MQVSQDIGHASNVTTLLVYADYIAENEGGKGPAVPPPDACESDVSAGV